MYGRETLRSVSVLPPPHAPAADLVAPPSCFPTSFSESVMKRIAIVCLGLIAAACSDDKKAASIIEPIPSGNVQAVVQRVAEYGRDSVVYRLHVGAKDVAVGAYQGLLTFDPAAMQILA